MTHRILTRAALVFILIASCGCENKTGVLGKVSNFLHGAEIPTVYKPFFEAGIASDKLDSTMAALPYKSISLSRSGCYGTCPVYEIVLHSNQKAEFVGIKYVDKLGAFEGEVSVFQYGKLCYLLDEMKFTALPQHFRARWTDSETILVTANTGRKEYSVSDYGDIGPIKLWAIQQAIDSIRHEIEWRPIPPKKS